MSIPASLRELQTLSAQQWLDRASRALPQALSVVLVIAIAWQLVQLMWLLLDRGAQTEPVLALAPAPPTTARRNGVDIQGIVAAHLFGVPQAVRQTPEEAPQTQMNLVLSAVFAASDPAKGLAIIGESAQAAKVFSVGQSVRPGTLLHAVYPDRVILERGGQLEALALPKQSTAGLINRTAPARPAGATQFAENLRHLAQNNPGAFAEIVRPQPVFANGVQRGYRVYPGRNRQSFAKLGLQPGDLITAVNGTPLDDPQRGMEVFNTISSSDRVRLMIERNGQAQELTLNTAQIMLPDAGSQNMPPSTPVAPREGPAFAPVPE